jgi:hypothetical protein
MGRLRSVIAAALFLAPAAGCAGDGFWKHKPEWKVPEMSAPTPGGSPFASGKSGVVQAGGTSSSSALPSSLSWLGGKSDKAVKGNATSIAVAWQNKVDYLPDPARSGAAGPGLAGQIFLFGSRDQFVLADGTLTIDLYDETPRPPGVPANKPERWQYKKDVLKEMRDVDERFGPNYVIFLPWPTYRPDVTRVRITVRYDPEHGYPLYAQETKLHLDTMASRASDGGATNVGRPTSESLPNTFSNTGSRSTATTPNSPSKIPPGVITSVGPPPNTAGPGPGLGVVRMTRPASDSTAPPSSAGASTVTPPADLAAPVTVYPRQP